MRLSQSEIPPGNLIVRPAEKSDSSILSALLNREYYIHRHLDWRPALQWLGTQPYWLIQQNRQAVAALACPPDPPQVAWIRLFAASASLTPSRAWRILFDKAQQDLANTPGMVIAAVALQHWFSDLLVQNGFVKYQDIVVLSWDNQLPNPRSLPAGLTLRNMLLTDLPQVAEIDQSAFEPLWQNSLNDVSLAFKMASYATVVEKNGFILGFQISTSTPLATHLARLAVRPEAQRQNIAYVLVYNLFSYFRRLGSWQLTVNTQDSNSASLALYQSMGFELTGESFPVYKYSR